MHPELTPGRDLPRTRVGRRRDFIGAEKETGSVILSIGNCCPKFNTRTHMRLPLPRTERKTTIALICDFVYHVFWRNFSRHIYTKACSFFLQTFAVKVLIRYPEK